MDAEQMVGRLHWLGHDSFRLDGSIVIYFDPWKLRSYHPPADLVLVSHEHQDHCSPEDVKRVRAPQTIVLASAGAAAKLSGARTVHPGEHVDAGAASIECVPAYNLSKFRSPGVPFHPKEAAHVGYVVTLDGIRLYFAGDTDAIPEMKGIRCDVAMLPVSGIYVMTVEEAAEAARMLRPAIAVPMHYGSGIGTPDDGQRFQELYGGEVALLAQE